MKIKGIAHVGIACADGNKMVDIYSDMLGAVLQSQTEEKGQQLISSMVQIGDSCLELMETTTPDGVIGKYIAKRGQGVHHISFAVEGLVELVSSLEEKGYAFAQKELSDPHLRFAFISPKSAGGLLIELVEHL